MTRNFVLVAAVTSFVLFGAAPQASAAMTASATLSVKIATLPTLDLAGSGTGSSTGVGGSATLSAGVVSGFAALPIMPPLSTLLDGFNLAAPGGLLSLPASNDPLSFDGTTGTMGLNASAYLMMGASPVAEIPLAVIGVGGTQMFTALGGLVDGAIVGNPYQLGMVTIMAAVNGAPHTNVGTGVDNRTAGGKGTLVLVSPTLVDFGVLGTMASVATLTIEYVPEPGTLLLFGVGVAGLGAVGRRLRG